MPPKEVPKQELGNQENVAPPPSGAQELHNRGLVSHIIPELFEAVAHEPAAHP